MSAKIFPLTPPRERTDAERLADVLGRKWLRIIPRGALPDTRAQETPEPRVVTEARKRALEALE